MKVGKYLSEEEILLENGWVDEAREDMRKFSRLYDKYFEAIFGYVFRRTENEAVTADIASQVFLKAMQNLEKYEFRGLPFSAWLFRIAANEINRYYRKRGKNQVFSIEEDRLKDLIDAGWERDIKEEQMNKLLAALKDTSTQVVEILELRFFEERSFKEISYILNITESGAKMRTYRAIEKIKQLIGENS